MASKRFSFCLVLSELSIWCLFDAYYDKYIVNNRLLISVFNLALYLRYSIILNIGHCAHYHFFDSNLRFIRIDIVTNFLNLTKPFPFYVRFNSPVFLLSIIKNYSKRNPFVPFILVRRASCFIPLCPLYNIPLFIKLIIIIKALVIWLYKAFL